MADYQKAIDLSKEIANFAWEAFDKAMSKVNDEERAREKVRYEASLRFLEKEAPHTISLHGLKVRARKL